MTLNVPISLRTHDDGGAPLFNDDGDPYVDVAIDGEDIGNQISSGLQGHLTVSGCLVGDINDFLLGAPLDLAISLAASQISAQISSLETAIEDALGALWVQGSAPVLDTELTYDLHPTAIEHEEEGLRIVMGGLLTAEEAPCIAESEVEGSLLTVTDMPAMSATVPNTLDEYHAGILLSDDFTNQALYAVWRGGVMCFAVADLGDSALSTSYLGLLLGLDSQERLDELLFLGEVPMMIRTVPEVPPQVTFDGDHDINIIVEGLGIEFYPMMQDRFTRLATVAIDVTAGVDLEIDPTGALAIDLHLDTDHLNPRVTYNEIAPDLNELLESNFGGFLGVIIDTVGGSLLEGMTIGMPTFNGLGLTALDLEALGSSPTLLDFLGTYALLGQTTGGESSGGCDGCADSAGCGADGCAAGGLGDESGCGGEGGCGIDGCG
ncbi:MAG: hypothetical protein CL928_05375, partial [Deltaproteobacteria bacterium]|nr:hypothetical protein [Deltaproteobacteria bacterium]